MKQVDTRDLKSLDHSNGHAGSIPAPGTIYFTLRQYENKKYQQVSTLDFGGGVVLSKEDGEIDYVPYILDWRLPISIDINCDDETLINGFKLLLKVIREADLKEKRQKPLGQKDFEDWQKYGVFKAFDLKLWAKINGIHYKDIEIADWLFPPDDPVDNPADRYRKVVEPKLNKIFNGVFIQRLESQMNTSSFIRRTAHLIKRERKNPE